MANANGFFSFVILWKHASYIIFKIHKISHDTLDTGRKLKASAARMETLYMVLVYVHYSG